MGFKIQIVWICLCKITYLYMSKLNKQILLEVDLEMKEKVFVRQFRKFEKSVFLQVVCGGIIEAGVRWADLTLTIVALLCWVCKGLFNIISCVFEKFHSKDIVKRDPKGNKEEKQARMVRPR